MAPTPSPYRPPTSAPDSFQTSTLCAQPSACSSRKPFERSFVIHVPSLRSPQAASTEAKARSKVTRNGFLSARRTLFDHSGGPSSKKSARGSGEHHGTRSGEMGHGKMPCRYELSSVPGAKSPPRHTIPFGPMPVFASGNR
jgi:hypothetical protein